ncbi:malto-oligosyltrehalose synthase [Dermabacter vaginalis]|uniref:Malto-oligosyltrehalose synthase n=1 Tax=Dermabacter vaginalis TaxID=1630135 RepID=A0ABX6A4M7_9MICO|nr:malto-oligosyltrehalose synthase [Dermabacter vaginalis]QEU12078.1 malto-oligosyltrehalose synthase [Dermabacter vaginalis]
MLDAPTSTYRLQITPEFTFQDAEKLVPYLDRLGVTHAFISPILQASPGSMHGYDVVDHSRVSLENGGEEGLRRLADALHERGMGLIVDVVPNHMTIPTPIWHNSALWSVLREGQESVYASWFDIDWTGGHGIVLPVLGSPVAKAILDEEFERSRAEVPQPDGSVRTESVLRYYDHVFPLAKGTEDLPLVELLEAQHYRLAYWRIGTDELNYRRFFDVETLAAIRVEDPSVFEKTHETLVRLQSEGIIDGYRIDHPDGLADPRGYLRRLESATGGAWTVIEKILEGEESLPADFPVAGTTGYDALWRVQGLFHDPVGATELTRLWQVFTSDTRSFDQIVRESAKEIISGSLWAEISRLVRLARRICDADIMLRDTTTRRLEQAIIELLIAMDRYRAYIVPGEKAPATEREVLAEAAERAALEIGNDADDLAALETVTALAAGQGQFMPDGTLDPLRAEFVTRFAQTCGPVHAKSLEDTAFYRYHRFLAVNEVGSDPRRIGVDPEALHAFCVHMLETFPASMTTLSTHDTKRSEDVRARLSALTEYPSEWAKYVARLHSASTHHRGPLVDPHIELFVWQTLAAMTDLPGSRLAPLTNERLTGYLEKAMREAKVHTAWVDGNEEYEREVLDFARWALGSTQVRAILDEWTSLTFDSQRTAILGQKLIQLTMPGVPDVYQGNETLDLSLVDPDNRRPANHNAHASRLDALLAGEALDGIADEKLLLVHRALKARRDRREAFIGPDATYLPLPTSSAHAVAFARARAGGPAEVVTVATRLPHVLDTRAQGWRGARIVIDEGRYTNVLTGERIEGGTLELDALLADWPIALLVREAADGLEEGGR